MTIDDAPLNSFHLRVVAYATGGYFVDGYILGMIGRILSELTVDGQTRYPIEAFTPDRPAPTDPDYEPALAM